jgi:hypothetical protein
MDEPAVDLGGEVVYFNEKGCLMAIPAYQLIPKPTDTLSQSQENILNNFTAIQGLIDVNHVDFSDGINYGKHNVAEFPVQAVAPTFAAGEVGLYNLLPVSPYPLTGVDEMFINKQNSATAVKIPMTASILSTNSGPVAGSSGWTYLPSGILLKWGTVSGVLVNSDGTVTLPTATSIPVFNNIFTVFTTQYYTGYSTAMFGNTIASGNYVPTGFSIYVASVGSTGPISISYIAIGY